MRVLSWNVNGLKAIVKKFGSLDKLLETLQADIICFQEVKLRKCDLQREIALAEGWESFFAFYGGNRGYSGVATFCRRSVTVPLHAEEGVTGILATGDVDVSGCDWSDYDRSDLQAIDGEGRCVITDHGEFLLFNVYGPAISQEETAEERFAYKMKFLKALQRRVCHHLSSGQRVILLGDLNISPAPIDRCDPDASFMDRADRQWLHSLMLEGAGPFLDTFRKFHPNRKEAFTCWSTASGARINNYGARIDLILAAPAGPTAEGNADISSWLTAADIWPNLEGSDHAPTWADFDFELPCNTAPPALSTSYTFTGKQPTLKLWLVKNVVPVADAAYVSQAGPPVGSKAILQGTSNELPQRKVLKYKGKSSTGSNKAAVQKGALLKFLQPKQPQKLHASAPMILNTAHRSDAASQNCRPSSNIVDACASVQNDTASHPKASASARGASPTSARANTSPAVYAPKRVAGDGCSDVSCSYGKPEAAELHGNADRDPNVGLVATCSVGTYNTTANQGHTLVQDALSCLPCHNLARHHYHHEQQQQGECDDFNVPSAALIVSIEHSAMPVLHSRAGITHQVPTSSMPSVRERECTLKAQSTSLGPLGPQNGCTLTNPIPQHNAGQSAGPLRTSSDLCACANKKNKPQHIECCSNAVACMSVPRSLSLQQLSTNCLSRMLSSQSGSEHHTLSQPVQSHCEGTGEALLGPLQHNTQQQRSQQAEQQLVASHKLAPIACREEDPSMKPLSGSHVGSSSQQASSVAAWKRIRQAMKPPVCPGHREPSVIRVVKKKGHNNGRSFYACARPDGPAPIGRCEFFQWVNHREYKQPGGNGAKRQKT